MSQSAITIEDCKTFLVADLKDQLKSRNASTIGKKAELLQRLIELVKLEICSTPTIEAPIQENTPEISSVIEKIDELPKSIEIDSTIQICDKKDHDVAISVEQGSVIESSIETNAANELSSSPAAEVTPSDSENVVVEVEKDIIVDAVTANEVVSSIEPPSNKDIPEVVPDAVKEVSLNEIIKTNLKKKIALSIQEDAAAKGDASTKTSFVRIDNFQRPLHMKLLLKWFEETLGLSGLSEENVWLNGIKSHCYVDLSSVEQAEICIARATGLKFPATSSKSLVASFTCVSAKDAPMSVEAQRRPEEWKAFREEPAAQAQTHSSSTPAASVGVKRKMEDVGGQMLKKAVEMATTGAAKSPRPITPSAVGGGGGGEDAAATGFLTRKHKLELGLLLSGDDENVNATDSLAGSPRATRPLPPPPPVLSLDDLFKKTKTTPCLYWLPAPLEKRLKTKASIRSRDVQGLLG